MTDAPSTAVLGAGGARPSPLGHGPHHHPHRPGLGVIIEDPDVPLTPGQRLGHFDGGGPCGPLDHGRPVLPGHVDPVIVGDGREGVLTAIDGHVPAVASVGHERQVHLVVGRGANRQLAPPEGQGLDDRGEPLARDQGGDGRRGDNFW